MFFLQEQIFGIRVLIVSFRSPYIDRDIRLVYVAQLLSGHLGPLLILLSFSQSLALSCVRTGVSYL
jgi:hypothetical protein